MGPRDSCAWLWDRDPAPASVEMLPSWLGPPALWVSTPDTQCSLCQPHGSLVSREGPWRPQCGPDLPLLGPTSASRSVPRTPAWLCRPWQSMPSCLTRAASTSLSPWPPPTWTTRRPSSCTGPTRSFYRWRRCVFPGPGLGGGQRRRPLPAACLSTCVCGANHGIFSPQIPSLPTGLFVSAKGEGCCLMQVRLRGEGPLPGHPWRGGREGAPCWARLSGVDVCVRATPGQPVSPLKCHPRCPRQDPRQMAMCPLEDGVPPETPSDPRSAGL